MIKIREVTSNYCLRELPGGELELIETSELMEEWEELEPEERGNYYVGVPTKMELAARKMLNDYLDDQADYIGLEEGILENMQEAASDEQLKRIQDVLDELGETPPFTYYEKGQRINPNY